MKLVISIFSLSILFSIATLHAQETMPITQEEALQKVLNDNNGLKISVEAFNEARADYRQTNAVFLPNISVSHSGFATTNPLMAFGAKLNQESVTLADLSPDALNNPSQTQNFATIFEVQQPILNADAIYKRKAAKHQMEAKALQTERTKDYITFELGKAYMQLQLAYKAMDVLEKAYESANANLQLAQNSFKQGYIQRADVLLVEVRVTEVKSQLQSAKSNVKNASNYVSFLMNDTSDVILRPTDSLQLKASTMEQVSVISQERADIKAMSLATSAYEQMYKSDKLSFVPSLNAFGSYQMFDKDIFQFGASGYLFGAELKWNILEGTKRFGKTQKSKASYERSKLEYDQYVDESTLELSKTLRLLEDNSTRLELSQLAMEQSREALRIRTNRFKAGLEKTTDLLIAETQYAQKQLEYYQTIFNYNITKTYLTYLTTTN